MKVRPGLPVAAAVAVAGAAAIIGILGIRGLTSLVPPLDGTPALAGAAVGGSGSAADPACAVILSTNDEHGGLRPVVQPWSGDRPAGGAEAIAAYVNEVRETSPCPVFLLSGGDLMQGTLMSNLTGGRATIDVMNEIGYDAAAIGNHEFDWGIQTLQERVRQARFPILSANIYEKGTDVHPPWMAPYAILERDGVRTGVIGATTRSTPATTHPDSVAGLEFRSIAEALDLYIPRVRAEGVDFVVVVMHAGGFCGERNESGGGEGTCSGEAMDELDLTTARFDYVVTGHTHSRVDDRIHGAPVVQSYANMSAIARGRLTRHASGEVVAELVAIDTVYPDSTARVDAVKALVDRYEKEAEEVAMARVATLAEPLEKAYRGASTLGRLVADAQRAATGAEVAIMNNGGLRMSLPAGPISYGELYRVQPFQNTLILLELDGGFLLSALESSIDEDGIESNISGLTVEYDPQAAGLRVLCARLTDGRPVSADSTYSVVVNNFMAAGGAGYWMLKEATTAKQTGIVDLDALVAYLEKQPQPITAPQDARWQAVIGGEAGCR
jgi:2',3'-cyclic-nucleotide 2'-phosphodiesterase (5'-nucleotidase family)